MSPRAATTMSAGRARLWPSYRGASTRTGSRRTGACRIGQEVTEWHGRAEHERRSESAAANYARAAEWRDNDGAGAAGRVEQSGFVAPGDDNDDDQGVRQAADPLKILRDDVYSGLKLAPLARASGAVARVLNIGEDLQIRRHVVREVPPTTFLILRFQDVGTYGLPRVSFWTLGDLRIAPGVPSAPHGNAPCHRSRQERRSPQNKVTLINLETERA